MLIRVHPSASPPGPRDLELRALRAPWYGEAPPGFRGRLVAESTLTGALLVITFWKDRALHDAAFADPAQRRRLEGTADGGAEVFDAVRDLPGLYPDPPTAAGSAVYLRHAVLELPPGGLATLRTAIDERLARHPRLLAGTLAAKPERPERLAAFLLFPDESSATSLDAKALAEDLPLPVVSDELLRLRLGGTRTEPDGDDVRKVFRSLDAHPSSD